VQTGLRPGTRDRIGSQHPGDFFEEIFMTARTPTALAYPKTVAFLLSMVTTTVWLGAVTASFADAAKMRPRQIELASVTVVYKAPAKVAQLTKTMDSAVISAAADGKL
jgi:hypothetical protein